MKKFITLMLALAALVFVAAPAQAHSEQFGSVPEAGSTVTDVTEIQFSYAEAVEQSFPPEVALTQDTGLAVELGAPTFDATGAVMTVPIVTGALPDGNYTAVYRIVSIDGHPTSGEFSFSVTGSSAPPLAEGAALSDEPITEVTTQADVEAVTTKALVDPDPTIEVVLGSLAAIAIVGAGILVLVAVRKKR
jgi:methionine-rich copper-binding protein CopC